MMPTPKKHLPKGYPLASDEESKRYKDIFERAFKIHETAHDFSSPLVKVKGAWVQYSPREGILSLVKGTTKLSKAHYCDCYERAYQELKHTL